MRPDDRQKTEDPPREPVSTERRSEPAWRNARERLEQLCLELSQREALELAT